MNREQVVQTASEVADHHGCHTVILYGSWARGDATAVSDIDLLCVRDDGATVRDARLIHGAYLDAFVYAHAALAKIDASLLRILGGVVIREREGFGRQLLERVEELRARGPDRVPDDERRARVVWAHKMLERIRGEDDAHANYRRMYLLIQTLEDHFTLQDRWFPGEKEAFVWLRQNDSRTHELFDVAYRQSAGLASIKELVRVVYGELPADLSADLSRNS